MRYLLLIMFLFISSIGHAADTKLIDMTDDASPGTDSIFYTVDDPSGTPVDRKVTIANLQTAIDTNLTQEQVEDFAGGMTTGNTETLITVTYQDGDGTIDYVVDSTLSNYTDDLTHTTDTNANTICTGTSVYLDGEGNCDTITSGGGGSITIEDEGSSIVSAATTLDFVGSGVVVTATGDNQATITISGGGGGGTAFLEVNTPVQSYKIAGSFITHDATSGARIDAGQGNWRLLFDDGAIQDEGAVYQFTIPNNYSSTPTTAITYSMETATSGKVEFEGSIMCVSEADSVDIGTASFSNLAISSEVVRGTAGYPSTVSITLTDDSCASGDSAWMYISTDADDAVNDTATGDREVVNVTFGYTGS